MVKKKKWITCYLNFFIRHIDAQTEKMKIANQSYMQLTVAEPIPIPQGKLSPNKRRAFYD